MRLNIEKLVYGGDGLARLPADDRGPGKAVFVPFVLPGETVEAVLREEKPGFARAQLDGILTASSRRVDPRCPYFQRCGGCRYQHTDYEHQLEIKAAILKENLRRIARLELDTELHIHPSPPWHYRNRSRFRVQAAPEFALGYYKFSSHELLPVEECPISSPLTNRALAAVWQLGRSGYVPPGIQEIEFFANSDDTQLLAEVYGLPETAAEQFIAELKLALAEISSLVFFAARPAKAEGQGDPKPLGGSGNLIYATELASYRVTAGAFFQVNRHLTDELVDVVVHRRGGARDAHRTAGGDAGATGTALDLYAGVGLFSSVLNREFERVIAVESSPTSHADLLYNSPANVKAVRATTEQYLENAAGKLRPQLVVVDPPRSGLGERVIKGLVKLAAPRITYVSCDPATLSRDLARLLQSGYRVEEAHLVDLFPQTYHLESVFHLVRWPHEQR
ncbi:MAG: class I SAM-dependent RNA methyltransferase [Acidobacteriia bacterium]|nr:class I SAM-dependent RNA methyltransferase [Terriglobia bacterium]